MCTKEKPAFVIDADVSGGSLGDLPRVESHSLAFENRDGHMSSSPIYRPGQNQMDQKLYLNL